MTWYRDKYIVYCECGVHRAETHIKQSGYNFSVDHKSWICTHLSTNERIKANVSNTNESMLGLLLCGLLRLLEDDPEPRLWRPLPSVWSLLRWWPWRDRSGWSPPPPTSLPVPLAVCLTDDSAAFPRGGLLAEAPTSALGPRLPGVAPPLRLLQVAVFSRHKQTPILWPRRENICRKARGSSTEGLAIVM